MGLLDKEKKVDKRLGPRIPQECIDLIVQGVEELKTTAQISRLVAKEFKMSVSGARKRVEKVWKILGDEFQGDREVERQKISFALLKIYREASEDMKLERVLELLADSELDAKTQMRLLSKWDPYKGATIALKALEQYTKLHGVQAPEQVQVEHTANYSPLTHTPQQRRARIMELAQKGELTDILKTAVTAHDRHAVSDPNGGPAATRGNRDKKDAPN